jgi:hypothetical protein
VIPTTGAHQTDVQLKVYPVFQNAVLFEAGHIQSVVEAVVETVL